MLIGLLRVKEGAAAPALEALGQTLEDARAKLVERAPRGEASPEGQIPFEPGAKKALELALRESLTLGTNHIGTEHVLLGIVAEAEGVGARIVASVEPDADAVRGAVLTRVADVPALQSPAYRVVDLEGEAADWEGQLNDAAARGYELVEILDRRAILRRA